MPSNLKIVVPYPAGGGADIMARVVGEQISRAKGTTIVVENKPGASANIGVETVARAAPNGTTVGLVASSFLINPHVRKLEFEPLRDFAPICNMTDAPTVFAVHSSSPYKTLQDFVDDARKRPGQLTIAANAPATGQHIAFELLKKTARIDVGLVPTAGSPPAVNMVAGNHVPAVIVNYSDLASLAESGALRVLATTGAKRIPDLQDIPTARELGYDFDQSAWFGLVAPGKTPGPVVNSLIEAFSTALKTPEIQPKLLAQGLHPINACGADFAAYLKAKDAEAGMIVREAKIKADN